MKRLKPFAAALVLSTLLGLGCGTTGGNSPVEAWPYHGWSTNNPPHGPITNTEPEYIFQEVP